MDILEKTLELQSLYDLYNPLLTDKQKRYFEQYYFDDFSISEISENENISRNGVHDLLKRTVQKLYDLEMKLHLHEQAKKREEIHQKYDKKGSDETIHKLLEELRKVE
ncbi:YlxM family DNA-binding protein [Candidatus Xianfuyuplasma coldseepsis]|uniref:UPF0122 protein G4Z02_06430 n=1 Tax=Candidatus Xianfuyuplasma coldseepsis TaxID=2782163 RepID=A0A7L7KTT1_9MOLU|nr:sigma factor-like helix-turn-helix DNA-binding protein [Xianfuyuplasma coldseepsis]QMS85404.1 hypothetical protein G4Z02_06430 [Xianfuyuplasma coldseepsis]